MLPLPFGREADQGEDAPPYVRHRPERTLLYQLIEAGSHVLGTAPEASFQYRH